MNKLSIAVAAALLAGSAQAAIPITTVTAAGPYSNSLAVIDDGVFPADGTAYDAASSVAFGPNRNDGATTIFKFDFGKLYKVSNFIATVDNNDSYGFTFYNGATVVVTDYITPGEGDISSGLDTFNHNTFGILATRVEIAGLGVLGPADGGDGLYGIGEAQFYGTAVPVPEPAPWSLMIMGFGTAGAVLRRRRAIAA